MIILNINLTTVVLYILSCSLTSAMQRSCLFISFDCIIGAGTTLRNIAKCKYQKHGHTSMPYNVRILTANSSDIQIYMYSPPGYMGGAIGD